jgi:hypothetical protein
MYIYFPQNMFANLLAASRASNLFLLGGRRTEPVIVFARMLPSGSSAPCWGVPGAITGLPVTDGPRGDEPAGTAARASGSSGGVAARASAGVEADMMDGSGERGCGGSALRPREPVLPASMPGRGGRCGVAGEGTSGLCGTGVGPKRDALPSMSDRLLRAVGGAPRCVVGGGEAGAAGGRLAPSGPMGPGTPRGFVG